MSRYAVRVRPYGDGGLSLEAKFLFWGRQVRRANATWHSHPSGARTAAQGFLRKHLASTSTLVYFLDIVDRRNPKRKIDV